MKHQEIKPHDIIQIKNVNKFVESIDNIKWIKESLIKAPFVVVRRGEKFDSKIPIGIRGNSRDKRYGTYLEKENILDVITPYEISDKKLWTSNQHVKESKIFKALEIVEEVLKEKKLKWGPTGSTAFELISNIKTINENSDLDILIKIPDYFSIDEAKEINEKLQKVPCKIDIQLQVPQGIISLVEYARGDNPLLLRTNDGGYILVKELFKR